MFQYYHIMCTRHCLILLQMHVIHLRHMFNIWNSRDTSVSLVTWLRCARGKNLGSILGTDTAIGLSLSLRQPPVQSVTRAISPMVKLPKSCANNLCPSSMEEMNTWSHCLLCLHDVMLSSHRDDFPHHVWETLLLLIGVPRPPSCTRWKLLKGSL